jgi:hypothetical protein
MTSAQLTTSAAMKQFLFGGYATFTLVSKKTGARKTFQVTEAPPRNLDERKGFFVKMLVGPDNTSDYKYLGFLYERAGTWGFKLNKTGWGAEAGAVIAWLLKQLQSPAVSSLDQVEFWHLGTCCRCGRDLTTPESIAAGIGPVCAGRM